MILISQGSNILPVGTILPYVGDLSKIPHGWALCDGTNGTPNLTGRFLQGSNTPRQFIGAGLPSISTNFDFYAPIGGYFDGRLFGKQIDTSKGSNGAKYDGQYPDGQCDAAVFARTSGGGGSFGLWMDKFSTLLSDAGIWGNSDTVQPPAYTVFYIMRII